MGSVGASVLDEMLFLAAPHCGIVCEKIAQGGREALIGVCEIASPDPAQ